MKTNHVFRRKEIVLEYKSEDHVESSVEMPDQVVIKKGPRRPVTNGIIWSQPVAQFILDIYPDILESDMDMKDLIHMINRYTVK